MPANSNKRPGRLRGIKEDVPGRERTLPAGIVLR
jgi:hypothetical protein